MLAVVEHHDDAPAGGELPELGLGLLDRDRAPAERSRDDHRDAAVVLHRREIAPAHLAVELRGHVRGERRLPHPARATERDEADLGNKRCEAGRLGLASDEAPHGDASVRNFGLTM